MKKFFKKLVQSTLIVIPFMSNLATTEFPECDGIIKTQDDKYSFCYVYNKYKPEDSVKFSSFDNAFCYLDLPGKVTGYYLFMARISLWFDDGSAMYIPLRYLGDSVILSGLSDIRQLGEKNLNTNIRLFDRNEIKMLIEAIDPKEQIEAYSALYSLREFNHKWKEEMAQEDYNKLNFEVTIEGATIYCYNVPQSSLQNYIKSLASFQILNKKYHVK